MHFVEQRFCFRLVLFPAITIWRGLLNEQSSATSICGIALAKFVSVVANASDRLSRTLSQFAVHHRSAISASRFSAATELAAGSAPSLSSFIRKNHALVFAAGAEIAATLLVEEQAGPASPAARSQTSATRHRMKLHRDRAALV